MTQRPQKMPACLMIQGTGSDTGKSTITAGLIRLFANKGLRVLPFKPQNMSNNAAVTDDGGEIGRAQAFQAFAGRVAPSKYMNPILLKPEGEMGSQLVICGQYEGHVKAQDYYKRKAELLENITDAFYTLAHDADLILIEGAGSPAEVNLRRHDIANMGFATHVNVPVILVADIHRGGVIASLVGTHHLLTQEERYLLKAYLINQFRGDETLFQEGVDIITKETGLPSLGIVPFFEHAKWFADEDSMVLKKRYQPTYSEKETETEKTPEKTPEKTIALISFNHIANADDFTPLSQDSRINIIAVRPDEPLSQCDWVILPGSKNTIADLTMLHQTGMIHDLHSHLRRGGKILGICGGFQMLGETITNPYSVEGNIRQCDGLGLLPIRTELTKEKTLQKVTGFAMVAGKDKPIPIDGYEIHLGETKPTGSINTDWIKLDEQGSHLVSAQAGADHIYHGQVFGCYLHGLFNSKEFYQGFFGLTDNGNQSPHHDDWFMQKADKSLDEFAELLEKKLAIDTLWKIAQSFSK